MLEHEVWITAGVRPCGRPIDPSTVSPPGEVGPGGSTARSALWNSITGSTKSPGIVVPRNFMSVPGIVYLTGDLLSGGNSETPNGADRS